MVVYEILSQKVVFYLHFWTPYKSILSSCGMYWRISKSNLKINYYHKRG